MDLEQQIKTIRSCTLNGDDPGVQSPDSGMTRPDFGTASRSLCRRAPLVLLVICAGLLALPAPAAAQTEIWSATLTVGGSGTGTGYNKISGTTEFGSLSDDRFRPSRNLLLHHQHYAKRRRGHFP